MADPRVSIVIACHNEAGTIGRKLVNTCTLASEAPFEVLVVDDRSTDGTADVARRFVASAGPDAPPVTVLANAHEPGKNGALRTAFARARGAVWLITDADVDLGRATLDDAWRRFAADPALGGLCLTPALRSADATLLDAYAAYYEPLNRRIKMFQSRVDSVPMLHGQAMFVRAACRVSPSPHLPADDVDFALQIRRAGYRVRYAADLPFFEALAADRPQLNRQKIRRAKAVMRSLWHHRGMLLNPRFGRFGLICLPLDFALYFGVVPAALALAAAALWAAAAVPALVVLALTLLVCAAALPATRQLLLYAGLLLRAHGELWRERAPHLRWLPHRQ